MRVALLVALVSSAAVARGEDRDVPAFSAVHVSAGMKATIDIGRQRSVHVDADPDVLPLIETVVEDGALQVRFKQHSWMHIEHTVRLTIVTPELRGVGASGGSIVKAVLSRGDQVDIEASGGSQITARGIDAAEVQVQASGGSILTLDGSADRASMQLSGGSQLHGRDFAARDASVHGSGGSEATFKASGKLKGSLSGGSQLHVTGGASTAVATSGGSEIYND